MAGLQTEVLSASQEFGKKDVRFLQPAHVVNEPAVVVRRYARWLRENQSFFGGNRSRHKFSKGPL